MAPHHVVLTLILLLVAASPVDGQQAPDPPASAASSATDPSSVDASPADTLHGGDLLLLGGTLFDGVTAQARPNPGILVRNGTILRLGVADSVVASAGPDVEVLRIPDDHTVLPGFFDLHAHYAVDLFGEGRVDEYEVNPVVFLANGVTSTFPAGEVDPVGMGRARLEIERGERPGPRIYGSGPYYGTARPGWDREAMSPDSIRAEVEYWAERGARGFKAKGLHPEGMRALIDAAHRLGLPVTAHMDSGWRNSVNPRDAILMGVDRVEHFLGGDALPSDRSAYTSLEALDLSDPVTAGQVDDVIRLYLSHRTFFDVTLTAYGYFGDHQALDPAVYETWTDETRFLTPYAREVTQERLAERRPVEQFERIYRVKQQTVRRFHEAGGEDLLTIGTDHPSWGEFLSGFSIHREMHALVRAGLPPGHVLRMATRNGARAMGVSDRLGTVEPGKYADLVVVRGDPLRDITATRDVIHVIKAGRPYAPAALLQSVEGALGPAAPEDADWWKGDERLEPGSEYGGSIRSGSGDDARTGRDRSR